jgi:Zn-dependent protease
MSIAFHEWAHGYLAYKFGDPTPMLQGRLTLNPFAHLDPVGTLMLFIVGIGWAKPIMLNPLNYPDKTKQMLVALAGPASNFLLAVIFSFILVSVQLSTKGEISQTIATSLFIIIRVNLILAIFNSIPIPPLDGSKVLAWMLPERAAYQYLLLEPYGLLFILLMLFTVGFSFIITTADFVQLKLLEFIKSFVTNYVL